MVVYVSNQPEQEGCEHRESTCSSEAGHEATCSQRVLNQSGCRGHGIQQETTGEGDEKQPHHCLEWEWDSNWYALEWKQGRSAFNLSAFNLSAFNLLSHLCQATQACVKPLRLVSSHLGCVKSLRLVSSHSGLCQATQVERQTHNKSSNKTGLQNEHTLLLWLVLLSRCGILASSH